MQQISNLGGGAEEARPKIQFRTFLALMHRLASSAQHIRQGISGTRIRGLRRLKAGACFDGRKKSIAGLCKYDKRYLSALRIRHFGLPWPKFLRRQCLPERERAGHRDIETTA